MSGWLAGCLPVWSVCLSGCLSVVRQSVSRMASRSEGVVRVWFGPLTDPLKDTVLTSSAHTDRCGPVLR